MRKTLDRIGLVAWGLGTTLRHGRPEISLGFLGGIGDDLLCTAPIHEYLHRGIRRIWFFTRHPSLYSHFDPRVQCIPEDGRYFRLTNLLRTPFRSLSYSNYDAATDHDTPCTEHLIATMCRHAGLTGRIELRPRLNLSPVELAQFKKYAGALVVQSSGLDTVVPMHNKQWHSERMAQVVAHFNSRLPVVQIGSTFDPALPGAFDLRGRTTLREVAAVLAQARLFVGLVGFPMHLARAVDCPAVIVYGGREPPELTGYICNRHLTHRPPCSPCWHRNRCDYARICLDSIHAIDVVREVEAALAAPRGPLAVTEVDL